MLWFFRKRFTLCKNSICKGHLKMKQPFLYTPFKQNDHNYQQDKQ